MAKFLMLASLLPLGTSIFEGDSMHRTKGQKDLHDLLAFPWRHFEPSPRFQNSTNPRLTCPPGPYLTPEERRSREAWLSDWAARRFHERFGSSSGSATVQGGSSSGAVGLQEEEVGLDFTSAAAAVEGRSYEDNASLLMPKRCPTRGSLSPVRGVCLSKAAARSWVSCSTRCRRHRDRRDHCRVT